MKDEKTKYNTEDYFDMDELAQEVDFKSEINYNFGWMCQTEYGQNHTPFDDLGNDINEWFWILDKMASWYDWIPEVTKTDKIKFLILYNNKIEPLVKEYPDCDTNMQKIFDTVSEVLEEIFKDRIPEGEKFWIV